MFSAFSTGLSGLMKVAQEKIVIPTSEGEEEPGKTEETKPTGDADSTAPITGDEAPAATETTPKEGDGAPAPATEDGAETAGTTSGAAEGENILGAAKEWGNYLFGGVKDVTMKGRKRASVV